MANLPKLIKRRTYEAAFRAEALRLASESCSTQAAARVLTINPKLRYKWQQVAQAPVAAAAGANLDPATVAELRQLRALARRQAQELEILKKGITIYQMVEAHFRRPATNEPLSFHRPAPPHLPGAASLSGVGRSTQPLLRLAAAPAAGGRHQSQRGK